MKNLKNLLCSKISTCILLIFTIVFLLFYYQFYKYTSKYKEGSTEIIGTIIEKKENDEKIVFIIKAKEKIQATYYKKDERPLLKLGDIVRIKGSLKYPNANTNFYQFNYQNYLKSKNIYSLITIEEYERIKKNKNFLYEIKNNLISYFERFKSKNYLMAFLLGDTSYIEENVKDSYQNNGISHLFAVSGMHITLFVQILSFFLKKFIKNDKVIFFILSIFLLFYSFLASFSPSIVRGSGSYFLNELRKMKGWSCTSLQILIFLFCLLLIINPYILYHTGFLFSFSVSFALIFFKEKISSDNYFKTLFVISFISFLTSLPISITISFQMNLLSVFLNLVFVPFVSLFLFPFTLVTMIFPFLDVILFFFISILEKLSLFFDGINFLTLTMPYIPPVIMILYYFFIYFILHKILKKQYHYFLLLIIVFIIHHNFSYFKNYYTLTMIDVGQGDAILLQFPNQKGNILIDTGGIMGYGNSYNVNLSEKTLLPVFKSFGINKLDYLILSHGDYDHMGEAINLVNNFKVEKVIFNCGEFNELEQELIEVLDKMKISYYSCIKELNINNNKLYFLNNKDYGNENDNSSVIYTELNNHKFLFMGDAGVEVEEDLINKYNLKDIDVLKVGHHGSKTSSSKEFINETNPKYSIISVGKNNRYGHPNDSVLGNLEDSKIYRTDHDGSILFKIKNNKLKIETCAP